jgi:Zn-dependent protease
VRRGIPAGSLLGARLEIGWSWLLVAPIVAVALFSSIESTAGSVIGRSAVAIGGSVLLLCSVLAHEAGHAVVAARHGIAVERVAIFLLGGFSEMDLDSATPRQERDVAIAGPAVSAVLGLGLWMASLAAPATHGLEPMLLVLMIVNVGVAGFNLLPAFPLDGGRLIRAALVERGVDRADAERFAVRTGMVLGVLVIIGAVVASLLNTAAALVALPVGLMLVVLAGAAHREAMDAN